MSQPSGKEYNFKSTDSIILLSVKMCNKRISEDIPFIIVTVKMLLLEFGG